MSRLDPEVRPEAYRLSVEVDPRQDDFRGRIEIDVRAPAGRRALELHAVELELGAPQVEDARGPVRVTRVVARERRQTVTLRLARGLAGERATLRIPYTGPLRKDLRGLYLARSGRRRYAATQLEAADARRFFPCFDEPDKKARFQISVTAPRRHQVVSNAPVAGEEAAGARRTVHFEETPPLSTYLIALVVGELEASRARRCGRTPIRVWHVPGKGGLTRFALEAAAESLARLERYFGLPYPYAKLDLIAVPDFEFGAMENAGAVTFRESLLLVDPATVTLAERKRVAEVIAHELAHMWFGDLVTMAWWDDLWLNESFATWMAFSVVDDWKPAWGMWLDFQQDRAHAFRLDGLVHTHAVYTEVRTPEEADENFDAITYEKGAAVVRMVERWLGAPVFRRGVRRYIRRHREGNARAADLWRALEEASGRPVGDVVRAWIERPGFPVVAVTRRDRDGRAFAALEQERFFSSPRGRDEDRRTHWPIPAVIRVGPARGRTRLVRELVDAPRGEVDLGASGDVHWAYANADEGGFYRPLHDGALLRPLLGQLGRLAAAERMGLVDHQWAGVRAGRARLGDLLDLVDALDREPEAEVLQAAAAPLAWLADQVVPTLAARDAPRFGAWLASRFGPELRRAGWRPARREDDAARLRRAALLRIVGAIAEDAWVLDEVEARIRVYLRDRRALDSNLAAPVVELAARRGDKRRHERYVAAMRRARTPQERMRFELALGAFRDPALVERTLELLLDDAIPTQDVALLIVRLFENPAAREIAWRFIQERWAALEPRITAGLAARVIGALPRLQTRAYRRDVAAFFRAHPIPSARRALRQALEQFDLDTELRRRARPELAQWLRARA